MKSTLANLVLSMLGFACTLFAGTSLGRLNTPDSTAGGLDYGLWCGLPLFGSLLFALARVSIRGHAAQSGTVPTNASRTRKSVGAEIGQLIAEGKLDAADPLMEAMHKLPK